LLPEVTRSPWIKRRRKYLENYLLHIGCAIQFEISSLIGYAIRATDGDLGKVDEFYFDDETWAVRYIVADTGNWLSGRKVLISPVAFGKPEPESSTIAVNLLTCAKVRSRKLPHQGNGMIRICAAHGRSLVTIFMPPSVKSVMWKILLLTMKIGRFVFWLWIQPTGCRERKFFYRPNGSIEWNGPIPVCTSTSHGNP
jgi:hypothetical protein